MKTLLMLLMALTTLTLVGCDDEESSQETRKENFLVNPAVPSIVPEGTTDEELLSIIRMDGGEETFVQAFREGLNDQEIHVPDIVWETRLRTDLRKKVWPEFLSSVVRHYAAAGRPDLDAAGLIKLSITSGDDPAVIKAAMAAVGAAVAACDTVVVDHTDDLL